MPRGRSDVTPYERWFLVGIFGTLYLGGSLMTGVAIYGLIGTLVNGTDPWKGETGALPVLWSLLLGMGFYAVLIMLAWLAYAVHRRRSGPPD